MALTVTFDSRQVQRMAQQMEAFSSRRIDAVLATALTRTARDARDAAREEIKRAIDRPTPYTVNGMKFMGANARKLEAVIWYGTDIERGNTGVGSYIRPQIEGGGRNLKRFERALQARGAMPYSMLAVPGPGAKLDQYGNIARGQIQQILSQLGTELLSGYSRTLRRRPGESDKAFATRRRNAFGRAGGQYVSITQPRGRLRPGIYLATGKDFGRVWGFGRTGHLTPVLFFVRTVKYTSRYRFYEVAQATSQAVFGAHLQRAIDESAARMVQAGA